MLVRRLCTFALGVVSAMSIVGARSAEAQGSPRQQELDEIGARGRALAGYQRAAWGASMQLMASNPDPEKVQRYVAYHADSGWVVAFGRTSADRDTFYVSHIAIPAVVKGQRVDSVFEFQQVPDLGPDTDFLARAARAMDLAVITFGATSRAYSAAALPNADGEWLVYLIPSADAASVWPLGDDIRYRVSADGRRILDTHRMHDGMVADLGINDPKRLTSDSHRKALHDVPEDSDVFHVLMGRPTKSEVLVTPRYRYLIGADGSVKLQTKERVVGATR